MQTNNKQYNNIPNIYTDGSCLSNPGGAGGWCFTLLEHNEQYTIYGAEESTTNNRMELQAVIEALLFVDGPEYHLYTDSQYTLKCATGVWRRKANLDLWDDYDAALRNRTIHWHWVKGHSGDRYNNLVDKFARKAAESV